VPLRSTLHWRWRIASGAPVGWAGSTVIAGVLTVPPS
jgi:hypothetical protein